MENIITQKEFFEKIDSKRHWFLKNNLCWVVNIFLILKELWGNITEQEVFDKSLDLDWYDKELWWKHERLMLVFNYFANKLDINYKSTEAFDWKFLHNRKMKKIFFNFDKQIYIASIKLDVSHFIIIDKVEYNNIYYTSVWTKQYEPKQNQIIKMDDFFKVYNKRGILINL